MGELRKPWNVQTIRQGEYLALSITTLSGAGVMAFLKTNVISCWKIHGRTN